MGELKRGSFFLTFRCIQAKQKAGQTGRTGVKCVKRKPNKGGGGGDKVDLLVLIDLVRGSGRIITRIFPRQLSPLPSSL